MSVSTQSTKAPNPWWVAVACGMASYIDAAAIVSNGMALAIYQGALGITNGQLGVLSAALTFCIAIGALIGGRLGDRFGRRNVFVVTMLMVIAAAIMLVFAGGYSTLLIGVILMGLATGADLPVSLASISEAATDENRGKLIGLSNLLWVAGIVGAVAMGMFFGDKGQLGAQFMYAHVGVMAIIVLAARLTVPESASWRLARTEKEQGVETIRANRSGLKDLLGGSYLKPFAALIIFYMLVNAAANVGGQYGSWIGLNYAGISISFGSFLGLVTMPIGFIVGFIFMKLVDTKWRMPMYAVGAVFYVVQFFIPAIFGLNVPIWIMMQVMNGIGSGLAFEGMMKVWAQESFPTLLRSSAQGLIVAMGRVSAAAFALVVPLAATWNIQGFYGILGGMCAVGYLTCWFVFKGRTRNEFDVEAHPNTQAMEISSASQEARVTIQD